MSHLAIGLVLGFLLGLGVIELVRAFRTARKWRGLLVGATPDGPPRITAGLTAGHGSVVTKLDRKMLRLGRETTSRSKTARRCGVCDGSGYLAKPEATFCRNCNGTGWLF